MGRLGLGVGWRADGGEWADGLSVENIVLD